MKRILYIVVIPLFCCCRFESSNKEFSQFGTDNIIIVPSFTIPKQNNFSDIIDSIYYLPLEYSEESSIYYINKLVVTNSGEFIVFDKKMRKVMRFDSTGHFLNLIGECGHGPNEFLYPCDIAYNTFENTILVTDPPKNSILEYTLQGTLVRDINTQYYPSAIGIVDQDHYCIYSDFIVSISEQDQTYNYNIIEREESAICHFEKVENLGIAPGYTNLFSSLGYRLFSKTPYSNMVLEYTKDSVIAIAKIIGEDSINWIDEKTTDIREIMHQIEHGKKSCDKVSFSNKYLFALIQYPVSDFLSHCLFVYDLKSGKSYMYGYYYNDIEIDAPIEFIYETVTAEKMIATVSPNDFESYCKKKREINDTINTRYDYFNLLSKNNNPILVINVLK